VTISECDGVPVVDVELHVEVVGARVGLLDDFGRRREHDLVALDGRVEVDARPRVALTLVGERAHRQFVGAVGRVEFQRVLAGYVGFELGDRRVGRRRGRSVGRVRHRPRVLAVGVRVPRREVVSRLAVVAVRVHEPFADVREPRRSRVVTPVAAHQVESRLVALVFCARGGADARSADDGRQRRQKRSSLHNDTLCTTRVINILMNDYFISLSSVPFRKRTAKSSPPVGRRPFALLWTVRRRYSTSNMPVDM
jgi:hypothetical protein